jgi:hypothetical protein
MNLWCLLLVTLSRYLNNGEAGPRPGPKPIQARPVMCGKLPRRSALHVHPALHEISARYTQA